MNRPSPFRQAFTLWERTTAAYLEALTRNPLFLGANASWLNGFLNVKKAADSGLRGLLSGFGLPTRHDQERTLHLLNQIAARLDDLEFAMRQQQARPAATATAAQTEPPEAHDEAHGGAPRSEA